MFFFYKFHTNKTVPSFQEEMYSKEPTQKLTMVLDSHVTTTSYEFKPEGAYLHVLQMYFDCCKLFLHIRVSDRPTANPVAAP